MISDANLLFIEPKHPALPDPIVDDLTRRMAAAFRVSTIGGKFQYFCGVHECVCGALSDNNNHVLPSGRMTNSLCVHYVAYHRAEVPEGQLQELATLPWGEVNPTQQELLGGRPRLKDASHLYEVERQAYHAERPGFRINELQISPTQQVPWHYHSNVQDTFYVIEGRLRLFLRDPKEEVRLGPGDTYSVRPRRPHLVTNGGDASATFLVLQGIGEYDFVPLGQYWRE